MELAYVTDGACFEEEILQMELIMLKVSPFYQIYPSAVITVSWITIVKLSVVRSLLKSLVTCDQLLIVCMFLDFLFF